ncbi:MAG: DUF2807 domain-containing protein [Bacteroidetes bacterium]|nr:DUF2807 domain-containing protein [Bacteroidota bacterium]
MKNKIYQITKYLISYISFIAFISLLLFTTCGKENSFDCLKSTGTIITEKRNLPDFNSIFIEDNIDVYIVQDTFRNVKIEAGKNIISNIKTEVTEKTLFIKNANKCNWVRSYKKKIKVFVTTNDLITITHDGEGLITSNDTLTDTLFLHITGAGDIKLNINAKQIWLAMYVLGNVELSGETDRLNASVNSFGHLLTKDLICKECDILSTGEGDAYIHCEKSLKATIRHVGNIYFYGNPEVERIITGDGKIVNIK